MAKYKRQKSGLYLPGNDSIAVPKPRVHKPWWAAKRQPTSARSVIRMVNGHILAVGGHIVANDDCCCEPVYNSCSYCFDGDAPNEVLVRVNSPCDSCNLSVADYVLTWSAGGSYCSWAYELPTQVQCTYGYYYKYLLFYISAGYAIVLGNQTNAQSLIWPYDILWFMSGSPPFPCLEWDALSIPAYNCVGGSPASVSSLI